MALQYDSTTGVSVTPLAFATAIGLVESNGNPNSKLGDDGRALGRFQVHPDECWGWAKRLSLAPQLSETWDSFVERIVEGFYSFHTDQGLTAIQTAMTWHIGHIVREESPDWDLGYASRFVDAARTLANAG